MITQNKIEAALKLLDAYSTTREKFESVRELLTGIDTRVDRNLAIVSNCLSDVEKLQKGAVVELTALHWPERSEEEKKRKRRMLLIIKSWNDLKGEVKRIQFELNKNTQGKAHQSTVSNWTKIAAFAKGPFGIITVAALLIVGIAGFVGNQRTTTNREKTYPPTNQLNTPTSTALQTKAIKVGEKTIVLTELTTGQGSECMSANMQAPHYHAKDHAKAHATDGSLVPDPGGCGFGKVDEVEVVFVE